VDSGIIEVKQRRHPSIQTKHIVFDRHQSLAGIGVLNADDPGECEIAASQGLVLRYVFAGSNAHPERCVCEEQADRSLPPADAYKALGAVHGGNVRNVHQGFDVAFELGASVG
jgi:hypothetical protein